MAATKKQDAGATAPSSSSKKPKGTYTLADFQNMTVDQLKQITGDKEWSKHEDLVNVANGQRLTGIL